MGVGVLGRLRTEHLIQHLDKDNLRSDTAFLQGQRAAPLLNVNAVEALIRTESLVPFVIKREYSVKAGFSAS